MTLVLNMQQTQPAKRSRSKKQIWDWAELVGMCESKFAIEPTTPAAETTLALGRRAYGKQGFAHIAERVLAVWAKDRIKLIYAETPRGASLDSTSLHAWVDVYPAAGGLTSYCIDASVNGHFCNKHLPLRADQRQVRSGYRHSQWYYGRSGVYQPGTGPYYPDAGPAFSNCSATDFLAKIAAQEKLPQEFRDAACSVVERAAKELAPFQDAILRYEQFGGNEEGSGAMMLQTCCRVSGGWASLPSKYGVRIRLKFPATRSKGNGWDAAPDFVISVCGPIEIVQFSPDVCYAWEILSPGGHRSVSPYRAKSDELPSFVVTSKPKAILDAARLWAAGRIHIPVED